MPNCGGSEKTGLTAAVEDKKGSRNNRGPMSKGREFGLRLHQVTELLSSWGGI